MKTILVVDDEVAAVEALTELLVGEGYNVISAGNCKEGLARLVGENPDLVLTDFIMPFADGLELVRRLRNLPEFRSLPVVVMSASPEGIALSDHAIGVSGVLKKPFGLDEVLAAIERLIGKGEP